MKFSERQLEIEFSTNFKNLLDKLKKTESNNGSATAVFTSKEDLLTLIK